MELLTIKGRDLIKFSRLVMDNREHLRELWIVQSIKLRSQMDYIESALPNTRIKSKAQAKQIFKKTNTDINNMSSFAISWHLVKRHKFGLVVSACLIQSLALMGVLPILLDLVR